MHHTNFLEPYIMSALEDIGYIEKDYINFLLEKNLKLLFVVSG